ncbi:MAG: glutamyl-tRNA reductase [Phycisphaeraceae bacterium]|nr:glutamyl-tRNA reductase [Phycisphaeraceae bacterium]
MRIVMVGLSHRTAPVAVRERLAMTPEQVAAFAEQMRSRWSVAEVVVLSTCNRMELYFVRPTHSPPKLTDVVELLAELRGVDAKELTACCVQREHLEAMSHLFRVAGGLESMVLGEPQILGQVRTAYESARTQGTAGPALHKLFQQALATAKSVRHETGIDSGRMSVGSVAVDFARRIFERFDDKVVLGIGAGAMAKLTLKHLQSLKPAKLWITNRTQANARNLVEKLGHDEGPGAGVRPWEDLDNLLVEADVVVTSTGSPEAILTAKRFETIVKRRRRRPIFLVDIAVPRDVEEGVGQLPNVYLYNIDDLQQVVDQTVAQRSSLVQTAEAKLVEAAQACLDQIEQRNIGLLVKELEERLVAIGQAEHERTLRKWLARQPGNPQAQADPSVHEALTEHTHRLIHKILHLPLSQLHRQPRQASMSFYATALRLLFDLSEEQAGEAEALHEEAKPSSDDTNP